MGGFSILGFVWLVRLAWALAGPIAAPEGDDGFFDETSLVQSRVDMTDVPEKSFQEESMESQKMVGTSADLQDVKESDNGQEEIVTGIFTVDVPSARMTNLKSEIQKNLDALLNEKLEGKRKAVVLFVEPVGVAVGEGDGSLLQEGPEPGSPRPVKVYVRGPKDAIAAIEKRCTQTTPCQLVNRLGEDKGGSGSDGSNQGGSGSDGSNQDQENAAKEREKIAKQILTTDTEDKMLTMAISYAFEKMVQGDKPVIDQVEDDTKLEEKIKVGFQNLASLIEQVKLDPEATKKKKDDVEAKIEELKKKVGNGLKRQFEIDDLPDVDKWKHEFRDALAKKIQEKVDNHGFAFFHVSNKAGGSLLQAYTARQEAKIVTVATNLEKADLDAIVKIQGLKAFGPDEGIRILTEAKKKRGNRTSGYE